MDFNLISLGCAKNRVDSEIVLADLIGRGHRLVEDPAEAELILVNTCAFIQPAVDEAIDTLLEAAELKTQGRARFVVGLGCLPQRYGPELKAEMAEIDLFIPPGNLPLAGAMIENLISGRRATEIETGSEPFLYRADTPRALTSLPGTAYVKIAEGCPNHCTYCTIPSIRGPQRSRSVADVLAELSALGAEGIIEADLVAQDLTAFGSDLGHPGALTDLIQGLDELDFAPDWVRLLYLNPALVDEDLIQAVAESKRVLPYLDLPLQHAAPRMIKRMGRRPPGPDTAVWIKELRRAIPGLVVRTTLMVGFPGETEQDFQDMLDFVDRAKIERLGAFIFCPEDGTPAARMAQDVDLVVDQETAAQRLDELLAAQAKVSRRFNQTKIGLIEQALVEGPHPESDLLLAGRTWYQAPEVDGSLIITSGQAEPGRLHRVKIIEAHDYDLVAEIIED